MLGKLKASTKAGHVGQCANNPSIEEKGDVESQNRKVSEKMSSENAAIMIREEEKHQRTASETSRATFYRRALEACKKSELLAADNTFALFEEVLPTDNDIVNCELRDSVRSNIKMKCDSNLGIAPALNAHEPKLRLLKPGKAKQRTIVRADVIKTATYTKPCRIKKLPAKLTDAKIDSPKSIVDVILPIIEDGPKSSIINNPFIETLNASNIAEIMNRNFVKKAANAEKSVEKLSNGPVVNSVPNGQTEDQESKNLKITMTKVGEGVWEQVLKTNIKKRRYNSWKMGKFQKAKKKRKIEQTDHDYTPNYTPPASKSQSARTDLVVKTSPSRRRTTPNRLKDCVEVPPSPSSKTCFTSALDPQMPSPLKSDQLVDDLANPLKTRKIITKSSKKLMQIEAENLLKMSSKTVAKVTLSTPGSQTQPLPRVLARKGSEPVKKPRTYKKRATSKIVEVNNFKTELTTIPDSTDSSQTAPLDSVPHNIDDNNQNKSPSKGIKVKKDDLVKEKKTQKKNIKSHTNKTFIKEKTSLKAKACTMKKTAKVNSKVAKLTAKAKAIRLQIKAEKKKEQNARKTDAKEVLKKRKAAANGNSPDKEINTSASCQMPIVTNASPKKMSLISQLKKKTVNASTEVANSDACVASFATPELPENVHSASSSISPASSQPCGNSEVGPRGRGRPRSLIPRSGKPKSIRFSRNGIRIGRPPKTTDGILEQSSLVGSQIQFLQSTVANCLPSSESHIMDKAKNITSPPGLLLPKNRSNKIRSRLLQSNAQSTNDALVSGPRAQIPMSSYAFIPQSSLIANNPKRSSIRQTECAFRYREIAVKKQDNFIQIVLMTSTRVKNGLNCQVMHELSMALAAAKSDPKCSLVVVNGTGSVFCSGVDLISLSMDLGQATAEKTSAAIRDFCKALFTFPKPLIAAVNGAAVGLGVTFLPFFDLVYASDKATFYTPYCKLGQIPEGGATFTLPSIMGYARANALLLEGRRITATEAYDNGLITQVLWPATFMEEVIPRVQALANRPLQAMESTKALVRYHEQSKLEVTLDTECRVLQQQWSSDECRTAIRDFLTSEEVV